MPKWLRVGLIVLGALAGLFVLANLGMLLLYRDKVLPNYSVAAVPISGVAYGQLDQKVPAEKLLPAEITLQKADIIKKMTPKDLGVAVDWSATLESIKHTHNWVPLTSLFFKHSVAAELKLDNNTFAAAATSLDDIFKKEALPQRIAFVGDDFAIVEPEDGFTLDEANFRSELIGALEHGKTTLEVPVNVQKAQQSSADLSGALAELQKSLDAKISFTVRGGQTRQLSRADIAGFFERDGQTLKLSEAKISQVVAGAAQGLGVTPVNQDDAVQASLYAISKKQPVTFGLADQGTRIYHYCVATKDVSASELPEYRQKLAAVYGDPKGWTKNGDMVFVYAESGCDYTAWLSSAAAMTSFSAIVCDNYYSCRVGPNVIVNFDRWKGATDPWNAAGGSIEDYRIMVINHETGHWLGFYHRTCPGPGQPAPVMQQQSIDLQGCTFNPWPTAAELAAL